MVEEHRKERDFSSLSRLVVKVGSALVADMSTGQPHRAWMSSLAEDIAGLRSQDKHILLVTSGAVALGRRVLGLGTKALKLEEKQAAAACGQIALMQAWRECFAEHRLPVAQLLLTIDDSEDRKRYLNARNTLDVLLENGVIPIINENDTVATSELRVGDNDRLAARVSQMAEADGLILMSDVDGLYTADPSRHADAVHVPMVEDITEELCGMAMPSRTPTGTGGMMTKMDAAIIATAAGCHTFITLGVTDHPLKRFMDGGKATWFVAKTTPRNARKDWIAGALAPQGELVVDEGAEKALRAGNSLLPAGVREVKGTFFRGDAVLIIGPGGRPIGKGLIAYTSDDTRKIVGRSSRDIETILGYKGRDELIHRDDLVVM